MLGAYMRQFDFKSEYSKLLTPDIVSLLTAIHEFRGEQLLYIEANKDTLGQLLTIAKIQQDRRYRNDKRPSGKNRS